MDLGLSIEQRLARPDRHGQPLAKKISDINDLYEIVTDPSDSQGPGVLGSGSYGVVKRYKKRGLPGQENIPDTAVAIKEIEKRRVMTSQKTMKHIIVELVVLKKLSHPNVIRLFEVLHDENKIYVVMETCPGGELYSYIATKRTLPPREAAIILRQVLEGLKYIHAQHIVHRDIKPENILIDKSDLHIKIIDFGLAKYCGPTSSEFPQSPSPGMAMMQETSLPSPAIASTPCGTELYLALEAIVGILDGKIGTNKPWLSTRSRLSKVDVYGAGVITYAMLTGKLPFRSAYRQVRRTVEERQRRLQDLKNKISSGLNFPESAKDLPVEALEVCFILLLYQII